MNPELGDTQVASSQNPDPEARNEAFATFRNFFQPIALAMIAAWFIWGVVLIVGFRLSGNLTIAGQVGDLFGGINALFSGLALAGVVTAVLLQSRELSFQRWELEQTREQIRRTAEANAASASALDKQTRLQIRAAEIAALTALLNSIDAEIQSSGVSSRNAERRGRRDAYRARLDAILADATPLSQGPLF